MVCPPGIALRIPVTEFYAIEFPAVVINTDKAVKMLGGPQLLWTALQSESRRLHLSFRPNMLYTKPACGDSYPITGLLLRVQQQRNKATGELRIVPTILGRVLVMYKFEAMADFQFGPFERIDDSSCAMQDSLTTSQPTYKVFHDELLIKEPTTNLTNYFLRDTSLYLPPVLFSRHDQPCAYNFAPRYRTSEYVELEERNQRLPVVRKARPSYGVLTNMNEPTPMAPAPQAVERSLLRGSGMHHAGEVIKQMFEERPVWMRAAFLQRLPANIGLLDFRYALAQHGYHMTRGPWGRSWIRFGYDPRADKESRYYQVLDFRIQSNVVIRRILQSTKKPLDHLMTDNSRRGRYLSTWGLHGQDSMPVWMAPTDNENPDSRLPRDSSSSAVVEEDVEVLAEADEDNDESDILTPATIWELRRRQKVNLPDSDYRFSIDHLPVAQQTVYCMIDVDIPEVKDLLAEPPTREKCDPVEGWLDIGTQQSIRQLMNQYLFKWLSARETETSVTGSAM